MEIAKKYVIDAEGYAALSEQLLGQQIRGAFGELMHRLELPASKQFEDNTPTSFYFRDSFPIHREDNATCYPVFQKDFNVPAFICEKCGRRVGYRKDSMIRSKLDRDTKKAAVFSADMIYGMFRFEIVANLRFKEHINDLESVMAFIKEYGLRVGKRHTKGSMYLKISNVKEQFVTDQDIMSRAEEIKKYEKLYLHFLSSAILKTDPTQSLITAMHFYHDFGVLTGKLVISLPATWNINMLHYKESQKKLEITKDKGSPPGYKNTAVLTEQNAVLYNALALTEQVYGIGDWISFGKGNFRVVNRLTTTP